MSLLSEPPPLEPHYHLQGRESNEKLVSGDMEVDAATKPSDSPPVIERALGTPSPDHVDEEDIGESEKSDSEDDSEMEEILRQNSEISSSSDGGTDDAARNSSKMGMDKRRGSNTPRLGESLASTLAVIMIALWQLRIPVMYRDLARFVQSKHKLMPAWT